MDEFVLVGCKVSGNFTKKLNKKLEFIVYWMSQMHTIEDKSSVSEFQLRVQFSSISSEEIRRVLFC